MLFSLPIMKLESVAHLSPEHLGRALRFLRTSRDLGSQQVAELAEIGQPTLSRIENGHNMPSSETLLALLRAMDASLSDLDAAMRHVHAPRPGEVSRALPLPSLGERIDASLESALVRDEMRRLLDLAGTTGFEALLARMDAIDARLSGIESQITDQNGGSDPG